MVLSLELRANQDGTVMLNHWDSPGGDDMVLRISPNGDVHELSYAADDVDGVEIWTMVDLVLRLRELATGGT